MASPVLLPAFLPASYLLQKNDESKRKELEIAKLKNELCEVLTKNEPLSKELSENEIVSEELRERVIDKICKPCSITESLSALFKKETNFNKYKEEEFFTAFENLNIEDLTSDEYQKQREQELKKKGKGYLRKPGIMC
jgi:hypothetical protein